jgi:hypothetical protein
MIEIRQAGLKLLELAAAASGTLAPSRILLFRAGTSAFFEAVKASHTRRASAYKDDEKPEFPEGSANPKIHSIEVQLDNGLAANALVLCDYAGVHIASAQVLVSAGAETAGNPFRRADLLKPKTTAQEAIGGPRPQPPANAASNKDDHPEPRKDGGLHGTVKPAVTVPDTPKPIVAPLASKPVFTETKPLPVVKEPERKEVKPTKK